MSRKRRPFSLIEVMISVSLLAILLSSLFFWYKKISFEKKEASNLLKPMLEERYADIRLSRIVAKAKSEENTLFYTDKNSLFFIFDNGINPDPLLSDAVLGRLYHDDKSQTLCLHISPHPQHTQETPSQTYTLLKDVTDVTFAFYYPPPDPKKIVDPQTVGDSLPVSGWQQEWKQNVRTLPTMVKIVCTRPLFFAKREPIEFTYIIEEKNLEINYLR